MNDSREIENLIYTYAERIDTGDLEGVAELFRNGEIVSCVWARSDRQPMWIG